MEIYAGFVEHTDAQVGKLVEHLDQTGQRDNTIIFYIWVNMPLDQEPMAKAYGVVKRNIITYREYPATMASSWPSCLREAMPGSGQIGVEPTVRREITDQLEDFSLRTEPLVEQLRQIKSPAEVEMIKRAARYADTRHLGSQREVKTGCPKTW